MIAFGDNQHIADFQLVAEYIRRLHHTLVGGDIVIGKAPFYLREYLFSVRKAGVGPVNVTKAEQCVVVLEGLRKNEIGR